MIICIDDIVKYLRSNSVDFVRFLGSMNDSHTIHINTYVYMCIPLCVYSYLFTIYVHNIFTLNFTPNILLTDVNIPQTRGVGKGLRDFRAILHIPQS